MNFRVESISLFDKQAKRLSKIYPSLKSELAEIIEDLSINPIQGKPLGNGFYKIRVAIGSKGKGKSGGGRLITFIKIREEIVFLTSIYDKSEKESISDSELEDIFSLLP
jgi:hypothetical protein